MRQGLIIWTLVLLGLPHVAAAAGAAGPSVEQALAEPEAAASERPATPADDFALDLRVVPPKTSNVRTRPIDPHAIGRVVRATDRSGAARQDKAEEGLSFGLEVRRLPPLESRARREEDDAPGLQDDLQRLIEDSTVGVRGTYRF
jgi:hypothetical protein